MSEAIIVTRSGIFVTDIGEIHVGYKTFVGNSDEEIDWKRFSHDLFLCISHLLLACEGSNLFQKKIRNKKVRIIEYHKYEDIHSTLEQLAEANQQFRDSISLMQKGNINRLRTAGTGERP